MSDSPLRLTRRRTLQAMAGVIAALALPEVDAAPTAAQDPKSKYSSKVLDLVQRSLVIDMLAPLKLDFRPEAYALPLTDAEAAMFRTCGITGFHNSVGVGGASAYDDALEFIAAWSGFVGRNTHVFSLVGRAADLDAAKAKQRVAVIMGLQNADEFREPKGRSKAKVLFATPISIVTAPSTSANGISIAPAKPRRTTSSPFGREAKAMLPTPTFSGASANRFPTSPRLCSIAMFCS